MKKRANPSSFRTLLPTGLAAVGAGIVAGSALLAGAGQAQAQQAYYYPQTGQSVTVDLGALAPYGGGAMTPYGQAPMPVYGLPYSVQPYGGLPQPTQGTPRSYLNILGPDGQPVRLTPPGGTKKVEKKKAAPEPAITESTVAEPNLPEPQPAPTASSGTTEVTPPAEPTPVPAEVAVPTVPPAPSAATNEAAGTEVPPAPAAELPAGETAAIEQASVTPEAATPAETPAAPAGAPLAEGGTRLVFAPEGDELSSETTAAIDAVAQKMLADTAMKIQILAYSSGLPDAESQARRKSLARGLAVRSHLIKQGVPSNRIDVRAMGSKTEGEPADRVDIIPALSQ